MVATVVAGGGSDGGGGSERVVAVIAVVVGSGGGGKGGGGIYLFRHPGPRSSFWLFALAVARALKDAGHAHLLGVPPFHLVAAHGF